ncbi:MAG: DNA polymerase III subunit alpha [Opitutales bacterium]|nr:DNA polymerase III subunit alpha [Opitutales bacterium]
MSDAQQAAPAETPFSDFVHLHVHSQFSLLDGATNIKKLAAKAKEDGMAAVALTDHGNMFGIKLFYDTCRKAKIKPILGCEAYVARRTRFDKGKNIPAGMDEKIDRSGNHLILLAKNRTGYRNLVRLISLGWTEGNYYRPRIDKEILEKYHEGLIVCSACIAGEIPSKILAGDEAGAEAAARWFQGVFGDDFYLEVMRHPNNVSDDTRDVYERQLRAEKGIFKLAEKLGIKVVATNDVHFLNEKDADAHDILLCLNSGKKVTDENRLRYTRQEWFKTTAEMKALFHDHPETLLNTLEVANKVEEYNLDSPPIMPVFPIPESFGTEAELRERLSEDELRAEFGDRYEKLGGAEKVYRIRFEYDYLRHLTMQGAQRRWDGNIPEDAQERIDFELSTIKTMGFPGYFLIVQDFIAAAREMGVLVGPGRGSAAGSVVAYCLGITGINPMKYDLLFERFLNPDRISMPDIDIDFDDEGRGKVLEWVSQKYGQDHVAHIVTFGSMAPRMAIKDVARVLDLPLAEANRLAKLVPAKPKITMNAAMAESPQLREERNSNDKLIVSTLNFAEALDGSIRQTGVHACGTLISRDPLIETIPVMPTPDDNLLTTQYDGHFVEPIGLLKMDFLGLKTLSILKNCLANVKAAKGIEFDINAIPLDDQESFGVFARGETTGLFQFESGGMKKYLRLLKPNRFEDLVAMNALYRPGPMEYIPQFIRRKHGDDRIVYDHPLMERYLKDTYGITVYQEQVMLLSRELGQFTRGESDVLRKAMGKKQLDTMAKLQEKFHRGCLENPRFMEPLKGNQKRAEELIEKIWKDWTAFAEYAFNKSHSVCYAYVAYQTGYLKAHYPVEYMAAVLDSEMSNPEKMLGVIAECESMGIRVLGPNVNTSNVFFTPDPANNAIHFGFRALKGLGEKVAQAIIDERSRGGKYKGFVDFMERLCTKRIIVKNEETGEIKETNLNIGRSLDTLIFTGGFDNCEDYYDRNHIQASINSVRDFLQKNTGEDDFTMELGILDDRRTAKDHMNCSGNPMSPAEKLRQEKELLGLYLSGHPLNIYAGLDQALATFSGSLEDCKLSKADRSHNVRICGIIEDIAIKFTADNRKFATFSLETRRDKYNLVCFPSDYQEHGENIKDGAHVILDCELRYRDRQEEWSLQVSRISPMEQQLPRLMKKVIFVLNPEEDVPAFVENKLLRHVGENSGGTRIALAQRQPDGSLIEADLPEHVKTFFPVEKFAALIKDPAVLGYRVDASAPYRRPPRFPSRK